MDTIINLAANRQMLRDVVRIWLGFPPRPKTITLKQTPARWLAQHGLQLVFWGHVAVFFTLLLLLFSRGLS